MYDTTVSSLVKLNSIKNANLIYVGQIIKLPVKTNKVSYTVQKGDNLTKIAKNIIQLGKNYIKLIKI